jgi:hypothetical protein
MSLRRVLVKEPTTDLCDPFSRAAAPPLGDGFAEEGHGDPSRAYIYWVSADSAV